MGSPSRIVSVVVRCTGADILRAGCCSPGPAGCLPCALLSPLSAILLLHLLRWPAAYQLLPGKLSGCCSGATCAAAAAGLRAAGRRILVTALTPPLRAPAMDGPVSCGRWRNVVILFKKPGVLPQSSIIN